MGDETTKEQEKDNQYKKASDGIDLIKTVAEVGTAIGATALFVVKAVPGIVSKVREYL